MSRRRALSGDQVDLVIAIEMHLVVALAELLTSLQILDDVGIAGSRQKGGEPIEPGHDRIFDLASRYPARPSHDAGNAETAFQRRSLAARERCLAAIRQCGVLGTVCGAGISE